MLNEISMRRASRLALLVAALGVPAVRAQSGPERLTFKIRHDLTVKNVPAGAHRVQVWFWLPAEDDRQRLLDFALRGAPAGTRVTRESRYGSAYLYAVGTGALQIATDFVVDVTSKSVAVDPATVGSLTHAHRLAFAENLRRDVPNMQVTPEIEKIAAEVCGNETNVVRQVRRIYDHVIKRSDHYSKSGAPSASKIGSAFYCLSRGGGSCTDQHSLFSALARARGIPTRLHFGSRLQARNEGKDHDPGYRCWVEYFAPGFGWVPADVSAGDTDDVKKDYFASGLDARRLRWAEGRDLELTPRPAGPPVNLVIGAYVLVDGKPHDAWDRRLSFSVLHGSAGPLGTAMYLPPAR